MRLRRLSLLALSIAFAAQAVSNLPVAAAAPPTLPSLRGEGEYRAPTLPSIGEGERALLSAPRIVDVRKIARRAPTLPSPASGGVKFATPTPPSPAGVGGKKSSVTAASLSGPQAVEAATLFAGLSLGQNEQLYGQDQAVEPADAQIAASPSALVEIAGNTMALFGPDGSLQWTVDLHALFQLPTGYVFYAPSLQYDYGSGRWFLGGIASNTSAFDSWLLVAVSQSGNPFGTWSFVITDATVNNPSQCQTPCNIIYFMRESIAVTGDKVVQAAQPQNCLSSCSNIAGRILVVRKDQLLAGVQPAADRFTLGMNQTDFLAVQPQSVGGTFGNVAFLVWLKPGGPVTNLTPDRLGLLQITGLPSPDRTTTVWEKDFSAVMPPINLFVPQPGGYLYASPTPITSAIYRDGQVVLAMNDNCGLTPDPRQLYCVRIIKITNFGNATAVANDNGPTGFTVPNPILTDLDRTLGLFAANLFDASLAIDPSENLFVTAAFSSSDLHPGMAVTGISAPISNTSTFMPVSPIAEGPSSYISCGSGSNNPWGAYMRSVPDPINYSRVWMPGEVALSSCNWATAVVSATMGAGPRPVTMSPPIGSIKGGQVVEIDGSFFVPNSDRVLFGSNPGTILAESPTTIIVSAPPGVSGPAAVTVLTPDGAANAGTFTYLTPGQLGTPPTSSGRFRPRG